MLPKEYECKDCEKFQKKDNAKNDGARVCPELNITLTRTKPSDCPKEVQE